MSFFSVIHTKPDVLTYKILHDNNLRISEWQWAIHWEIWGKASLWWLQQNWKGKTIRDWLKWKLWGKNRWVLQLDLPCSWQHGRDHISSLWLISICSEWGPSSYRLASDNAYIWTPTSRHEDSFSIPKKYVLFSQVLWNSVCSQLSSYLSVPEVCILQKHAIYSWCKLSTYIQILKFSLMKNIFEIIF